MHHTGKKESRKEKVKKWCHEKFALRGSEPGPSKYVRTEKEPLYPQSRLQASSRYLSHKRRLRTRPDSAWGLRRIFPTSLTGDVTSEIAEDDWERGCSIHWTTSVSPDNSSLKQVYIPSLWGFTVFKDVFFFRFPCRIKSLTDRNQT